VKTMVPGWIIPSGSRPNGAIAFLSSQKLLFSKMTAFCQSVPLARLLDVLAFDPVLGFFFFNMRMAILSCSVDFMVID